MSVLSTLALLVTTAAVKSRPNRDDQMAKLKAELADARRELELERQVTAVRERDLAEARRDRDDWRERAEAWRERAEARPIIPLGGQHVGQLAQQNGLQQALLSQMAQSSYQNAQYQNAQAYAQCLAQHQGLLGAQALDLEMCNCVPSRAQVWAARLGDGC
jgi:hypothetical protein